MYLHHFEAKRIKKCSLIIDTNIDLLIDTTFDIFNDMLIKCVIDNFITID